MNPQECKMQNGSGTHVIVLRLRLRSRLAGGQRSHPLVDGSGAGGGSVVHGGVVFARAAGEGLVAAGLGGCSLWLRLVG